MKNEYDIIVIGGGHAGIEACQIASQFGFKIGLITLPEVKIGSAPCNPSIGGVGKGQVVREIDCLGGVMGILADRAGIQYRTLNESKGFAVQSTRVQIDKIKYSNEAEKLLQSISNISIIYDMVIDVKRLDDQYIIKGKKHDLTCKKLIMTVGTFLNGKLHTGLESVSGGRVDCDPSPSINSILGNVQSRSLRFKTGTPPRIKKDSINFNLMSEQKSDDDVINFHVMNDETSRNLEQKSCYLTYTNVKTTEIISENKEKSPMFNGSITATGARYCPSIEDKVFRYPDKSIHHVFVEPESHELDTYYPSGISSSLPENVQNDFIQTIKGFENAVISIPGYAVEYDVLDTTLLSLTLEHKNFPGLYFAGQVNGTSGYEEAAGQGLIAGINACFDLNGEKSFILSRNHSYIGVMIDDLVSNLRDEPYRLFTARAENRLFLREDNTFYRMLPYRKLLNLDKKVDNFLNKMNSERNILLNFVNNSLFKAEYTSNIKILNLLSSKDKKVIFKDILNLSFVDPVKVLIEALHSLDFKFNSSVVRNVAISTKYSEYIAKSKSEIAKIEKNDNKALDIKRILASENVSFECKQRIEAINPENYGQLRRINGIRQVTLALVSTGKY